MYFQLIYYNLLFFVIFVPWSLRMGNGQSFCGDKLLLYDEACLHIKIDSAVPLKLYIQSSECFQCDAIPLPDLSNPVVVSSTYPTFLQLVKENENFFSFNDIFHFGQHGHYNVTLSDGIDIVEDVTPEDAYAPLKIELLALFIILVLWSVNAFATYHSSRFARYIDIRGLFQTGYFRELQNDFGSPSETSSEPAGLISSTESVRNSAQNSRNSRVQSLDAFRGLTIVLMLFVNYGGGKYKYFQHTPWNGLTIADIVFPWFAFIMGMSLLLSVSALYRNTNSRSAVFLKVFLRSLVLIVLGIMLNSVNHDDIYKIRFPGVLQRLGLSYFIVGSIEVLFLRAHPADLEVGRAALMQVSGVFQWILSLLIIAVHSCITFLLHVPGCPPGYLGPGGLHMHKSFENCTGGAAGYIDRSVFKEPHIYSRSSSMKIYHNELRFDPEGLLGSLMTAFTVFLGVHAIRLYVVCRSPKKLIIQWVVIAIISGVVAGLLCQWSQEEGVIPINKNLWSLSFSLATASLAFIAISILYFIIDYKKFWSGSPFKEVGKNAILIYLGSSILKETFPWHWTPVDLSTHTESLIMDTWGTVLWIVIAVVFSKNNIYLAI
ncbi:heparan-alpha-glucosaminide N-acetyltransferase isoform X2 [Halyomorpha halys]|uniref:heparan-alpha-glucosaminide N-acetyltransferase isoform X2 n=1 Tax=Halyomorpha halys TaxID=286706 RepID=UPI000D0C8A24|nr:heparan-alpha-glucosaminide N-acetyltransferase-like isoform X2 [Halyomorpha halys]